MSGPNVPTGDCLENEPGQPGYFDNPETPNTCLCCGTIYYQATGARCICAQGGIDWLQDELRRMTCFFHLQEKVKDGLFGALVGDFTVPGGRPLYKPARSGRVAPIVGGSQIKR